MSNIVNLLKDYRDDNNVFTEPDGWYFGVAYYYTNIWGHIPSIEIDYKVKFVETDYLVDWNVYVKGNRDKWVYKTMRFIEHINLIIKAKLYRLGLFPMQPKYERLSWEYFLRLPRGK